MFGKTVGDGELSRMHVCTTLLGDKVKRAHKDTIA